MNARGFGKIEPRDASVADIQAEGVYRHGTWRVVMTRPLSTADPQQDIQFQEGRFIPIAFAVWDGSNGEAGTKHTLTTWYWLLLASPAGLRPYLGALAVMVLIVGVQFFWLRSASRKKAGDEPEPEAENAA
jgi:hypothetical protein